jgi:hypothetical protein
MAFVPASLGGWNLRRGEGEETTVLHLAAGDVSPTASTMASLETASVDVRRGLHAVGA